MTKGWLTKITNMAKQEIYQVRIDSDKGYFIIEIDPITKQTMIIKDRYGK